ncbi:MAG: hypothetical protein M1814_006750 [Vezdaea aestivalis]|nr:MAG: hypothetical protein M1814_006750 [Vezdaea aestivalis]
MATEITPPPPPSQNTEMAVVATDVTDLTSDTAMAMENGDSTAPIARMKDIHDPFSRSSIVSLTVGTGDEAVTIGVHKLFLEQSPYFRDLFTSVADNESQIDLPDEDPTAVQSVIEYLYTKEYFPARIHTEPGVLDQLEKAPGTPEIDESGEELLKHARIYLLAVKFSFKELKDLAFAKIHIVESMPKAELVYARFVYENTDDDDVDLRHPVASFWASKSHVVRHSAQAEFQAMCLDFPKFGFDVLTLILNQKEKGKAKEKDRDVQRYHREDSIRSSVRKRPRHSDNF